MSIKIKLLTIKTKKTPPLSRIIMGVVGMLDRIASVIVDHPLVRVACCSVALCPSNLLSELAVTRKRNRTLIIE